MNSAIVYYTDSKLDPQITEPCRAVLAEAAGNTPIISVSQQPLSFGVTNICLGELPYHRKSMFRQIMAGLDLLQPETYVFLCEHDVLYHPSHFSVLPAGSCWLFNLSRCFYWTKYDICCMDKICNRRAFSHAVARKDVMLQVSLGSKKWKDKSFPERRYWNSCCPNIDIRHGENLTGEGPTKRRLRKRGKIQKLTEIPGWKKEGGLYCLNGNSDWQGSKPKG